MENLYTRHSDHLARTWLAMIIIVLSTCYNATGKNYYFSTSNGDDSRTSTQAQNPSTPWKTINKLNSFFSSLLPGDSILFNRGETFYGSILVNKSGTSAQNIIISSYGTGSKPIITAFQTVSGWTSIGTGIYESSATNSKSTLNIVTVNGKSSPVGRYPNSGYLSYESAIANTSITDNQLSNTPNWTGAQVVIRCNNWSISKGTIINHTNNTISYSGASQNATPNFGYFIQRDPKTLDTIGEWYLNATSRKIQMYFGTNNPGDFVVKASTLDTLVYCNQKSYVTFSNLSFEGANFATFFIASGQNISVLNCNINQSGTFGILGYSNSPNLKIENNYIIDSYHKAIQTLCDNASIRYNTIKNTGIVPGLGNEIGGYSGIELQGGDGTIVEFNTVDSSGNNGIFLRGNNSVAKNNFINYFGLTVDDCGGIYTAGAASTGRKIIGNIILNGIGNRQGTSSASRATQGIYLDEPITGVYVEGNTVAHCGLAGLRYHNAYNITARFNTLFDNPNNIYIIKSNSNTAYSRNLTINDNISVCKTSTQLAFSIYNYINDNPLLYGNSDSNNYCRPISEGNTIKTRNVSTITNYSLETWQSATGNDLHSHKSPQNITDVNDILFEYNATTNNKIISLSGTYISVDSLIYSGTVTIAPYSSVILFKSSSNNQTPNIQPQGFQINENSPNGTNVGTVLASDPDAGQTLTYSILSGNTSGAFAINASTGVLTVANSSVLNFEVTPTFALIVKVQDNGTGTLSSQATVTVSLTNMNEVPVINNQAFNIAENSSNGTNIGTVVASDPDAGQTLTYSILSGNTSGAYAINASTGVLTVANSSALNFEVTPAFALIVKVQDNGTGTLSSQATGTVSLTNMNEVPVINNQAFNIAENSSNGTNIGIVVASDPDAGQTLTYSILSGNTSGAFAINASTGVLTVANSSALNFEVTPSFALIIKVQDNGTGTLSSQATVTVSLTNMNEVPVINNQAFNIAENSANGSNVGTVIASDPDAGQTLTYSILSGNNSGAFAINASTGVLTVANSSALNFEVTPSFALIVKVQDNGTGTLSSQATVTVSLTNMNEVPAINNQAFNIAENSANGSNVGTVVASDPDAGQTLTYSILSGNTSGAFAINASTGVLTVANSSALNFEVTPSFALIVKVQDNGTGMLSSQATVTVSLTNINEAPVVNNQSFDVSEFTLNGTSIGTVFANDPDAGQILSYLITGGNTGNAFSINSATGEISVANSSALNYSVNPVFSLNVKVTDNGVGNLFGEAIMTINILQEPNQAPVINNQAFTISENSSNGTNVGTVVASDPDAGQTLTYSILSGNTIGAFAINASTGVLTVANSSALNFEVTPSFALIVKVQDNGTGTLSSQATVTVSLTNINEVPVINNQAFAVAENAANGTNIGTVVASDPDAGQTLTYSILSGNTSGAFAINASTGVLTVANSSALNFEATPTFALIVKVQDNGTGTLSSQATVTVSLTNINEVPVINNQAFNIAENSSNGTNIGTVVASDPDAGQTLTYSILSGNTSGAFAINASTGVLTVANSSALNFEVTPSFALIVKVQDNGTGTLSSQATVTVSLTNMNEVPAINNQAFNIAENSANGSNVGTVVASDPDAGQTLTYSILSGNTSGAFAINASTGVLTVANSSALNFEVTPSFALIVKVQDNGTGTLSSQATVTVSLTNINEVPVINNQAFAVAENAANGTNVGTVVASDPDAGQSLTYSILSGNTIGAFAINASTGVLTVANSSALNFEAIPTFALIVKVQDNGTGTLSSQATVTISLTNINEVPVINNQAFAVAENSSNGTNVGTVVASDPDAGQSLTYSILSGNTSGAFAINASTGVLTVANSSALNFEAIPTFALIVKVQDNGTGTLSSQATVTVSLTNINEVPVISNQAFAVAENSSNGTNIGTVLASDPDAGQILTYSILSGNTSGAFAINASTGVLTVANSSALNFEAFPTFALIVKVQDNGTGTLSSQATVTISLTNINEVPVISNQAFAVAENLSNGTNVGTVVASDPDAGQILTYSILSGNTSGAFAINASTGVLTVANSSALNFEVNPSFALIVKVQDNGTGMLSSQATVTVSLTNINEVPVINNQAFAVAENSSNGTNVGTVVASDPDAGQILTYSILSGNTSGAFAINASTGVLTVANSSALNFEVTPSFALIVKVQDNGTGTFSSQATVSVSIIDVNDAPQINNQNFSVDENTETGTRVYIVSAVDEDAGQILDYSILSGNTNGAFAINSFSGEISVANSTALNFENNPNFSLNINVQDNGLGNLSSQAQVSVSLSNINESPIFTNQIFSIVENSANGTNVGTVLASDPDAGQTLTYSILSGNTDGTFAINSSTGVLTVANSLALNFETLPLFELVVEVQDNGIEPTSSQAIATITLTDSNEAPVISNQTFDVNEFDANGSTVGTVFANDPDAGQVLSYLITGGNTGNAFSINSATGEISVANSSALNYSVNPVFSLNVKVTDNGVGNLFGEAIMTINILQEPNQAPVINNQAFAVAENSSNGTNVGTVVASDPDAGQILTYSILSGNTSGAFAINASTGVLTVANSSALNFEVTPAFALIVKVQDNGTGTLSSQATVTVSLTNINEVPVINNQAFAVAENAANGTNIGTVVASDPDAGQTLTYSILSGNTSGAFAINASTGVLTVANSSALNFEVNPSFALIVKVQDNGTGMLSSQATVTVSLTNINEVPVINNQAFAVAENSSNGTNVGTVVASDPDADQTLTYSILSGNTSGAFAINASTGVLTVANSSVLNFEVTPAFALIVKVQDNGTGTLSSQATVTISLTNINEVPVINNQAFNIAENSANGSNVGTVLASDPDAGQTLTYSILSGNTNGAFAINASTGVLTVANSSALNFEVTPSFALIVKVQDNGTGTLSSQATVTVSLTNINEVPVINNQAFAVAENAANGTNIGTVVASDPDADQTLTYSILSGNTSGAFAINASTGVLNVANSSALNFEVTPTFALIVKVQDNGTGMLSSQATVTVSLTNINEAPVVNYQSFDVTEFTLNGTSIGTVFANDPDAGQILSYLITGGNTGNAFSINSATGEISVANSSALNYSVNPVFSLNVKVTDNGVGNLFGEAIMTINILQEPNQAPVINNQAFAVAENAANGTNIGTVLASDPDAGQILTYSILSGNTNGAFAINASTGVLTVANSSALNFEAIPTFALIVKVQDNGTGMLSSQATVTVSLINMNEVPVINNQAFTISENSSNGTNVGTVFATDPDAGQTLTYSILSGNTSGAFAINASTGVLTVTNSSALNFEVTPSFALIVKVQDNGTGTLSSQATITISLTNINEVPVINNQEFTIAENSANGSNVGTVIASDPDAGQTLTYSILSGNTSGAFAINASTGVLTVANSSALNFEVTPTFALIVKVQDNGTGMLSSQATITISLTNTNEVPVINNQEFTIAENSANGTNVGTVVASDPDAGQTLTYSILSGNSIGAFSINASTGVLTVANSSALNFETNPSFSLVVNVQDNGSVTLSSQATVTINLVNVNEAPVVANQLFIINENLPNGTIVGTMIATDPDAGQSLAYSILSGNVSNDFVINATTGVISVANSSALNFEENSSFALIINVQDNGTGNLSSQAIATVALTDVNESPIINNQFFTVAENSSIGTAVGTVVSTDPDAGQAHVYSIVSGNENGTFSINATSGIITIANSTPLNFEENPSFVIVVNVQDNGAGNLSSQALITVSLSDVNENPVVNNQTFSVYEFAQNGTEIGYLQATDPDAGQTLTFTISAGNTNNAFEINSLTGLISIANSSAISFLSNPVFYLMVRVSDNGAGNLFNDCIVTIHVLPGVNQPPVINDQTFFINENSVSGSLVGLVEAYDPDAGQILNYSILAGNIANAFEINSSTGEITVSNSVALNFNINPVFSLIVNVQDNGTLSLEDQATVTINLIDTSEPPVITDQSYNTIEHQPVGTQVCTVVASVSGSGNSLLYSIQDGNIGNSFSINSYSGDITISNPNAVCYEGNPEFDLLVKVQDSEGLSAEAIVTVNVMDINEYPVCNNQVFTIQENAFTNTIVGTVVATEPDFNQTLIYTIVSGNPNDAFSLNEIDGLLRVNNSSALNFEENQLFTLTVSVQDNGIGNLITNSTITVNLQDVNEYPVFENQVFDVVENSAIGTPIGYLLAADPDAGQSIKYNIIGGNENQTFTLNTTTGLLSVADPAFLFFDLNPVNILSVVAQDNSTDSLVTLALVTINVIKDPEGQIIYIDPTNENDLAENGTIDHPYDSWEDVTFKNGITYLQKRGTTYKSDKSIIISKNANITVDAYGNGNNPVIYNLQTAAHTFELNNSINCIIRNLEIMTAMKGLSCILITGDDSKSLTIENCKLHDAVSGIISNARIKDLKILNTSVYNTGLDGISAEEFVGIEIRDCKISSVNQNWFSNPYAAGSCINLYSSDGKVFIHKNELDHSATGNMSVIRLTGLKMEGIIEYNNLSGNKTSDNQCLNLNNSSGIYVVRYNTIIGGKTGVNVNSESAKIYYNQMIGNQVAVKVQQKKAALILNNTFVANENFAVESLIGSKVGATNNVYYLTPAAPKAFKFEGSFVSDFNLFNIEKSGFINGYNTLASWIAASGQDKNSQVKDPQFENVAEGNFRIKPNSPCINKGSDLKLEKDFFGTKVPQAGKPDIGFCEVENGSIDPEEETIPLVDLNRVVDLTVYPNPTTGILNIDLEKVFEQEVKISIVNMNGYQIYSNISQGHKELEINLENEKSGMYIVHFTIGGMEFTKGVVVKR